MKKGISVGVLLTVAAVAMSLAGATSAAGPGVARSATPSAASGQVRAAGAAVVKQIGARNYAGPNCPGVSWNCTTSTRVIQVATRAGINVANTACVLQICEITQSGPSNVAKCTQNTTLPAADQSCTITQTGASNMATVAQTISQSTTATQSGTQTADVRQGTEDARSTAFNVLKVTQSVSQSTKTLGGQEQNAHQEVFVSQWAAGAGYNQSNINQSQLQKAFGGAPQSQNVTPDSVADCPDADPGAPNACSDVNQHSASGTNYSALNQSIDQDANTAVSGAVQKQGSSAGGLEGHVHQDTVSGSSQNKAKQAKHQKANGPGAIQTQYDPVRCCGTASQFGGSGNVEDINQSSSIGASSPGADQHSTLIGESVTPDGKCSVNQHAAIDSASANNSETLTPCPYLTLTTSCSTGSIDIDAVSRGDNCTAFEPYFGVDSTLDKTVKNVDEEGDYDETTSAATGDTVEFKIDYHNTGPADADNVIVTDVVPGGLTFNGTCSSNPNPCSYDADTKTLTWDLSTVPGAETPSLTFQAEVVQVAAGDITNTASVATLEEGAGAVSDSATVTVVDEPPPVSLLALGVRNVTQGETAFSSVTDAVTDDVLEYEIIYTNTGGSPAHNVTVTAPVPTGTTVSFAGSTSFCPYSGGFDAGFTTLTCVLGPGTDPGTIAPGDLLSLRRVTYMAKVTVPLTFCGTLPATASVDTDETATVPATPASVDVNGAPLCLG